MSLLALGTLTMLAATAAEAQWALVAKRAIGRVEQMSQQSPQSGGPSYDSAAVMLEAPADKVYAAVLTGVRNNTRGLTDHARRPFAHSSSSSPMATRSPASRSAR